jgi:hypothetical protein
MARAPKRDKFHKEASEEVYDLLTTILNDHHRDLSRNEFLILMKHGGWKSKGKTVLGKVSILNDAFRRTMDKDAIVFLNADVWIALSNQQKTYVLDNQLYGLDVSTDRHGGVKEASDGRPLLTTIAQDFEGFVDVVKRHGPVMGDIKRLLEVISGAGQMSIDEVPKEGVGELPEPREGVRGKINPDGTVDVDNNQLTFDEVASGSEQEPGNGKVADISEARQRKQDAAKAEDDPMAGVLDEDELPFELDEDEDELPKREG